MRWIVTVGVDVLLQVVAVQAQRIVVVSVTSIASPGIDDCPTTAATTGVCGSLTAYNGTQIIASLDMDSNGANNSGYVQVYTWSAGSAVGGPYVNTGGTSWTTSSDETLKDIIEPITDASNKVGSLRAVIGKFKTDPEDTRRT